MHRFVLAILGIAMVAATPAAAPTPPPTIYRVVTTELCTRLHDLVRPAVAMVLQNDQRIVKGTPLFQQYRRALIDSGSDRLSTTTPETEMTLQRMSYLIIPTAKNLIAAQTLIDDAKLVAPTGNADDDATLQQIKKQMLELLAFQSASLDLINGFVQTQQLGDMQHQGYEYIAQIQGGNTTTQIAHETPNQYQDPNSPGLSPNPYSLDVTQIPGLAVGYNPLSNLIVGMQWLQTETAKRESDAGKTLSQTLQSCHT